MFPTNLNPCLQQHVQKQPQALWENKSLLEISGGQSCSGAFGSADPWGCWDLQGQKTPLQWSSFQTDCKKDFILCKNVQIGGDCSHSHPVHVSKCPSRDGFGCSAAGTAWGSMR